MTIECIRSVEVIVCRFGVGWKKNEDVKSKKVKDVDGERRKENGRRTGLKLGSRLIRN